MALPLNNPRAFYVEIALKGSAFEAVFFATITRKLMPNLAVARRFQHATLKPDTIAQAEAAGVNNHVWAAAI